MKRVISLGAILVGTALLMAPGAATANTTCPAGQVLSGEYCVSVVTLHTHVVVSPPVVNRKKVQVRITIGCPKTLEACQGRLLLRSKLPHNWAFRASTSAATSSTIGSASYSIASGKSASVVVTLNSRGRAALKSSGKLKASVVTVSSGQRTTIGDVTIKARKHVTKTNGAPGFTG